MRSQIDRAGRQCNPIFPERLWLDHHELVAEYFRSGFHGESEVLDRLGLRYSDISRRDLRLAYCSAR